MPLWSPRVAWSRPTHASTIHGGPGAAHEHNTACRRSSRPWNNRQYHVRGIRAVVMNCLDRRQQCGLCSQGSTRVGITVKAWEIAARNLQTNAMTGLKDIAGGPQVNGVGVDLTRLDGLWSGGGLPIPRPDNAVRKVLGKAAGMHVNQLGGEVRIHRG